MRNIFLSSIFLLATCFSTQIYAADMSTVANPVTMLQTVANQTLSALEKANAAENPSVVFKIARENIVPHADIDMMAKKVLPPRVWEKATPEQQQQFKEEFTNLLIRNYGAALSSYKNAQIHFNQIRGNYKNQQQVTVHSTISSPNNNKIAVDYVVIRKANNWLVSDFAVEHISLIDNFRSQFSDLLSRGNMQSVLESLAEKNKSNNS